MGRSLYHSAGWRKNINELRGNPVCSLGVIWIWPLRPGEVPNRVSAHRRASGKAVKLIEQIMRMTRRKALSDRIYRIKNEFAHSRFCLNLKPEKVDGCATCCALQCH